MISVMICSYDHLKTLMHFTQGNELVLMRFTWDDARFSSNAPKSTGCHLWMHFITKLLIGMFWCIHMGRYRARWGETMPSYVGWLLTFGLAMALSSRNNLDIYMWNAHEIEIWLCLDYCIACVHDYDICHILSFGS